MSGSNENGIETGRSFAAAPFLIDTLKTYLEGSWRLERVIHHGGEDRRDTYEGEAQFTPDGDAEVLEYNETGELETPQGVFTATRSYTYKFIGHALAEVRFPDGTFFHVLDFSRGISRVEHICEPDLYQGLFRPIDQNTWLSVWRISGPRKSQVISTHFHRISVS